MNLWDVIRSGDLYPLFYWTFAADSASPEIDLHLRLFRISHKFRKLGNGF